MQQIPTALLDALEGLPGFDRAEFLHAHHDIPSIASVRFHPVKSPAEERPARLNSICRDRSGDFNVTEIPWCPDARGISPRPAFTFDPAFHAGAYYVQEAASMFLGYALTLVCGSMTGLRAVDICAAPGGKSTHLSSLSFISSLLSNEIIRSRVPVLYENTIKWGMPKVFISQDDPARIGRLTESFDVMVVDAPCSGSGLFRRDPEAVKEWSPRHVELCSQRQQRILADALPALTEGGILTYSTGWWKTWAWSPFPWRCRQDGASILPLHRKPGRQGIVFIQVSGRERASSWLACASGAERGRLRRNREKDLCGRHNPCRVRATGWSIRNGFCIGSIRKDGWPSRRNSPFINRYWPLDYHFGNPDCSSERS